MALSKRNVTGASLRSGLVALVLAGCMGDDWPAPPPVSFDEFAQEHQEWRGSP